MKYSFTEENREESSLSPIDIPNAKHISVGVRSQLSLAEQLLDTIELELDVLAIDEIRTKVFAEIFAKSSTPESAKRRYIQRTLNKESFTAFAHEKMNRPKEAERDMSNTEKQ